MTHGLASALLLTVFPAGVIAAALKDATSFTIPNWIPGLLALAFLPVALLTGLSPADVGVGLAVGVGALVLGMGLFALGWCGGGDAKLLAAAALWLGWPAVLPFMMVTGLAGGLLAAGLIAARGGLLTAYAARGPAWLGRLLSPTADLPYGLAIAAGGLFAFPSSAIVMALTGA